MVTTNHEAGVIIFISPGAELNFGPSEDSDSMVVTRKEGIPGTVVGDVPGAHIVTIPSVDQVFYFHQPETKVVLLRPNGGTCCHS